MFSNFKKMLTPSVGKKRDSLENATQNRTDRPSASTRLREGGRIPINIWGDVMLDGTAPAIRRVLTGQDAHECLLSYFYFNEILSLQEVTSAIPDYETSTNRPVSILDRFLSLKESTPDPQFHMSNEILRVFVPTVLFFQLFGQNNTEFLELGCTFFSAIEKMKICSSIMDANLDFESLKISAIDHSDFMLRGTKTFHKAEKNLVCYSNYGDWRPRTPHPFHLSRFVASYASKSTDALTEWLQQYGAFHVIDVVNLESADFQTVNNGLEQVFFNFPKLIGRLENAGWNVYLGDLIADYNSGRKCAVMTILGIRGEIDEQIRYSEKFSEIEGISEIVKLDRISEKSAIIALRSVRESLSQTEWDALAEYKIHFPIWGKPFPDVRTMDEVNRLIAPPRPDLDLRFEGGQINAFVRHALDGEWFEK